MKILLYIHIPIAVNFLVPAFQVFIKIKKNIKTQIICVRMPELIFEEFPDSKLAGKFIKYGNGVK